MINKSFALDTPHLPLPLGRLLLALDGDALHGDDPEDLGERVGVREGGLKDLVGEIDPLAPSIVGVLGTVVPPRGDEPLAVLFKERVHHRDEGHFNLLRLEVDDISHLPHQSIDPMHQVRTRVHAHKQVMIHTAKRYIKHTHTHICL